MFWKKCSHVLGCRGSLRSLDSPALKPAHAGTNYELRTINFYIKGRVWWVDLMESDLLLNYIVTMVK